MSAYESVYRNWQQRPEAWWEQAAEGVLWDRQMGPPLRSRARVRSAAGSRVPGSTPASTASTATWPPAAGEQPALIWDSPMTGRIETFTYAAMLRPHRQARRRAGGTRRRRAATAS